MGALDDPIERGWDLLDRGEPAEAYEVSQDLLAEDPDDADALLLAGTALMEADRLREAEPALRRAVEAAPGGAQAVLTLGQLLYWTCRFEEALEAAESVLSREEACADAHYLKGLALDLLGRRADADSSFAVAAGLDAERFRMAPTLGEDRLRGAVRDALAELPAEFQGRIGDLPIVLRDVPTQEILSTLEDPSPDLLGLFVGIPLTERSHLDVADVPSIALFTRNLERACSDGAELVEEIRITLLHEVGHFLGLDEQQLADRGYE